MCYVATMKYSGNGSIAREDSKWIYAYSGGGLLLYCYVVDVVVAVVDVVDAL